MRKLIYTAALLCLPLCAVAEVEEIELDALRYVIDKEQGTAEVTGFTYVYNEYEYNEEAGNITVPQSISYEGQDYTVTSIGEGAFVQEYQNFINAITLPPTIKTIKAKAFSECYLSQPFTLPDGLETIGEEAFHAFGGQGSLTIPFSVKEIGQRAFYNCYCDTITVMCPLTSITAYAFQACPSLSVVYLPQTIEIIEEGAFGSCNYLRKIELPASLKAIGKGAFAACRNGLKNITIPEGVTEIGQSAFSACHALEAIIIPEGITAIEPSTFADCYALKTATLPSTLKSIGKDAFDDCLVTDLYCYAETPPYVDPYAFRYNRNYDGIENSLAVVTTVHVPESALSKYKSYAYTPWPYSKAIVAITGFIPEPQPEPEKCATPTITQAGGKIHFDCETEGAQCVYKVSAKMSQDYTTGNSFFPQSCPVTYTVTVKAQAEGYEDSDSVTQTFTLENQTGDIDGDGELTIGDITRLINQYLQIDGGF